MANLKITFYKDYPITPESEYAPYFDTLVETGNSIYAALQYFKKVEYNTVGDFTPLQDYINVQSFAEVDGCNYVRVEVVGEYTKYYYINDIIALSEIQREGRYYRPAQVFLYEDVFLSNYYQVTPTGALNKPLVSGNVVQCNQYANLQEYIRTPPVTPRFEGQPLSPAITNYNNFVIYFTYTTDSNAIFHAISKVTADKVIIFSLVQNYSKIVRIERKFGGTFSSNINILNMYVIPYDWVAPYIVELSPPESFKGFDNDNISWDLYFLNAVSTNAPIKVASLTPTITGVFADLNKYFLKTANNFINIPWKGGTPTENNKPTVDIYIEYPAFGYSSDTITIFAIIGESVYDISNDFKIDIAINQAKLQMAQSKTSTELSQMSGVLGSVTGIIGGAAGAVGGVASGNYFGAVTAAAGGIQSAIGGIQSVVSVQEARELPSKMTIQGNAAAAITIYGGITILKLENPVNIDTIKAEIYRHGYIYPERPYLSISHLINNNCYIKLENAVIMGSFGVDISRELKERFERGIKFIRLEDI